MKRPSFQFYPSDWMVDPGLSTLDYFHVGVFIKLLCFAFQTGGELRYCDGGEPFTITDIATSLGLETNKTQKVIETLLQHGCLKRREDDGCLYNARMVRDCKEAQEYYEAKKRASEAGVEARRRIRESNVEPNENQPSNCGTTKKEPVVGVWLNQKATPSSSSSSSSSIDKNKYINTREAKMPESEQEAVEMCIDSPVPEKFIREKAYPQAVAHGFEDRGGRIRNFKQWVTNYWNASENVRQREVQAKKPPERKLQYESDRIHLKSL